MARVAVKPLSTLAAPLAAPRAVAGAALSDRLAQRLDIIIFGALLLLFPLLAVPYGAVEPWWEAGFASAVFLLTALWVIEGALRGSWQLRGGHWLWPLFALALFAFAQTLPQLAAAGNVAGIEGEVWRAISADPYATRGFALRLLALILTIVLLRRYVSSHRRLSLLIHVLLGVAIASALFGLLRQTTQQAEGFLLAALRPGEGYAQFINRNHFAFLMEMALGLALGLMIGGGVRRERLLIYVAALAPIWTALILSNSRGGIFSMLTQVLFVAWLFGTVRTRQDKAEQDSVLAARLARLSRSVLARAALVLCLIVVVGVSVIWMGGDMLVNRLETIPGDLQAARAEERASQSRIEIWRATWQLVKAHPIAGSGLGGYKTAFPQYHDASGQLVPQEAHNDYLELLAGGGIIGCALAGCFIVALIITVRRRLRSADAFYRAACFGALAGLFGVAVHSLVDFGLHITINALFCVALIAIATLDAVEARHSFPRKKTKNSSLG